MSIVFEKSRPIPENRKGPNEGMTQKVRAMNAGDCAVVPINDAPSFKICMVRVFGSGNYRMQNDRENGVCRFWRVS